jgi:hypothetical protein
MIPEIITNQICFSQDGIAIGWPFVTIVFAGLWIRSMIVKRSK